MGANGATTTPYTLNGILQFLSVSTSVTIGGSVTARAAAGSNARIAVDNAGPIGAGGYNGYEFYETGVLKAVQYWDPSAARVALNSSFAVTGTAAPGTAGANEVRIGAGQINAASDIETATKFRVNGSDQPVSTVSLVNVNASSTYDLLTVGDNEMWSLAIGNATDGYMVHAVFGKPSASSGAVMATNNNTNANLTVALVGNILRISNGVGSTRTMIYTLTKLR